MMLADANYAPHQSHRRQTDISKLIMTDRNQNMLGVLFIFSLSSIDLAIICYPKMF